MYVRSKSVIVGCRSALYLTVKLKTALLAGLCLLSAGFVQAQPDTIGISVRSVDKGRFTDKLIPVIEAAASKAGYKVVVVNADDSAEQQAADVAALAAQGVAGIVVGLVNSDAGEMVSASVGERAVPLVYMNVSPINANDLPENQSYVGPDEAGVGAAQALAVCNALGDGGRVGLLIGDLLHPAAAARTKAVQETMRSDACDGVELVYEETAQWNREFAAEVTSDWLSDGAGLQAIVSNNDPMGLGAIDALQEAGIDAASVFVTSVDGQPAALDAVRKGWLDATYLQDVDVQGREIFATLSRIIGGEPFETNLLLPLTAITPGNVDDHSDGS